MLISDAEVFVGVIETGGANTQIDDGDRSSGYQIFNRAVGVDDVGGRWLWLEMAGQTGPAVKMGGVVSEEEARATSRFAHGVTWDE
jgi:hypothetical protein